MKKLLICFFAILSIIACKKVSNNVIDVEAGKEDNKESVVNTYTFTKDGVSTVDIGESKELILNFRKFNNGINAKKLSGLDYYKKEYEANLAHKIGVTLSENDRNDVKTYINSLIDTLVVLSKSRTRPARPGQAGYISVSPEQDLMMTAGGVELGQVIQKALMGCMQINNVEYFIDKALNSDNTNLVENKNYTMMQHNWDIAYGYLGRQDVDQERLAPLFLANYIEKEAVGMKGLENIQTSVYKAFFEGRKAINNKDVEKARQQATVIKGLISKLVVLRTDFYYDQALRIMEKSSKNSLDAQYFHSMAEALGFTLCIPFVHLKNNASFTYEHAVSLVEGLQNNKNGLWDKDALSGTAPGSIFSVRKELSKLLPE